MLRLDLSACPLSSFQLTHTFLSTSTRLRNASVRLQQAQSELDEKQAVLDNITNKFEAATREKQELQTDLETTEKKIMLAHELISGLVSESQRWKEQRESLSSRLSFLMGDAAVAAAFASYSGPFNREYRQKLVAGWRTVLRKNGILCSAEANVVGFLSSCNEDGNAGAHLEGLPSDSHSRENGAIVNASDKYPLLIDPEGQALHWIHHQHRDRLRIVSRHDPLFRDVVEECLEYGSPLAITHSVPGLPSLLDSLLQQAFIKRGKRTMVRLGGSEVELTTVSVFVVCLFFCPPSFFECGLVCFGVQIVPRGRSLTYMLFLFYNFSAPYQLPPFFL